MQPRHDGRTKLPTLITGEDNQQMNVQRIVVWLAAEQTYSLTLYQELRKPMWLIFVGQPLTLHLVIPAKHRLDIGKDPLLDGRKALFKLTWRYLRQFDLHPLSSAQPSWPWRPDDRLSSKHPFAMAVMSFGPNTDFHLGILPDNLEMKRRQA
jgi:hypothetical protein